MDSRDHIEQDKDALAAFNKVIDSHIEYWKENDTNSAEAEQDKYPDSSVRFTRHFIEATENLNAELYRIKIGLKQIQSMCGNPNAEDACRLIVKKCEELLKGEI